MKADTKKTLVVTSIIGALVVAAAAILLRARKKRKALEQSILTGTNPVSIGGSDGTSPLISWPLKYGSGYVSSSERDRVRLVQMYLNRKINENNVYNLSILTVDGYFGPKTENALSKITGTKQVSYTLYNQMDDYLTSNPVSLYPKLSIFE